MANITVPKSFKAKIDRALHNLYQEKSTTLHPMTAIPIYYRRLFRGDRVDFKVFESILRSEPTFAPLLANWRLEFQWYFDSDANRYGWIDNNTRLTSQEYMTRKHHRLQVPCLNKNSEHLSEPEYLDSNLVGRGSVADYSGVAPEFSFVYDDIDSSLDDVYQDEPYGSFVNLDFILTYLNIIRNYHVNKQFPQIPYIKEPNYTGNNQSDYDYDYYDLQDLDDLFVFLRSCPNGVKFGLLYGNRECDAPSEFVDYYSDAINSFRNYCNFVFRPHGGIFCTQFEPDLYQNLLARDQQLLQSVVTIQDVAGQQGITIEQFRLKNHLQGLYDKLFVSGGTDRDASRTIWGIESNRDYDIPELLCVHSEIIGTNLIESTTAGVNGDVNNVAGSMSGNLNSTRTNKRGPQRFTAKTAGSLMCIVTLTPIVTYSQNIERHLLETNFMDEFNPDMARKGFEDVPMSDYMALPLTSDNLDFEVAGLDTSVGKQVAWLREMTAVNRVHGEFSNGGERVDWVLRRSYCTEHIELSDGEYSQYNRGIDISPYGKPTDFQYPFVSQSLMDPNFNLQCSFYVKAYRPVPRRFMPNLGY